MMKINKKGINLIKNFESLQLNAYRCPAGIWTIGYGHTKGVTPDSCITKEEAETMLREDVIWAENSVNKYVTAELNENQFSALVSFVFNLGTGAFRKSTLLKVINENPNDFKKIEKQFLRWVYAGGSKLNGLVRRREAEFRLYSDDVI